jgi:hypothetical protein
LTVKRTDLNNIHTEKRRYDAVLAVEHERCDSIAHIEWLEAFSNAISPEEMFQVDE